MGDPVGPLDSHVPLARERRGDYRLFLVFEDTVILRTFGPDSVTVLGLGAGRSVLGTISAR